jgi:hypothetical protein
VLYLIVVPLPQGENPFAVKINNNNNSNNKVSEGKVIFLTNQQLRCVVRRSKIIQAYREMALLLLLLFILYTYGVLSGGSGNTIKTTHK